MLSQFTPKVRVVLHFRWKRKKTKKKQNHVRSLPQSYYLNCGGAFIFVSMCERQRCLHRLPCKTTVTHSTIQNQHHCIYACVFLALNVFFVLLSAASWFCMVVGALTFANRLPFVHVYFYFDVRRSHTCTNDKPLTKFSFSFVFFLFLFEAAHIPTHSNTICVCCNNAQQIRLEFVSVLFVSAVFDSIQFISHFIGIRKSNPLQPKHSIDKMHTHKNFKLHTDMHIYVRFWGVYSTRFKHIFHLKSVTREWRTRISSEQLIQPDSIIFRIQNSEAREWRTKISSEQLILKKIDHNLISKVQIFNSVSTHTSLVLIP